MHQCDESLFPIVFVFVAGRLDEDSILEVVKSVDAGLRRAHANDSQCFQFVNAMHVEGVTPLARKAVAEWENSVEEEVFGRLAARIVLSDSIVVRGAITAISWFSQRMKMAQSCKDFDEGLNALRERMVAAGQTLTPERADALRQMNADAEAAHVAGGVKTG